MCGGTEAGRQPGPVRPGLSPRVRGNLEEQRWDMPISRSIPACAGEPIAMRVEYVSTPVYPRVCGGTADVTAKSTSESGLSPRVRGNQYEKV